MLHADMTGSTGHPARSRLRDRRATWTRIPLAMVLAALGLTGLVPPATAATVYEITGAWEANTPDTVASGDVATAAWRVNVNDDRPAPSNDPVDNVTFTVTLRNGVFNSRPDACLANGVTPASSISADGRTLVCNLGTHDQGTAVVVQAPVMADGPSGSQLSASGAIAGRTAELDPIDIVNPFGMDIRWGVGTPNFTRGNGFFDMDLEWTLSKLRGSDPGPQTVTYELTIASPQGAAIQVGPNRCTPFASGAADGHPWSGGNHPANQLTSFVGTCEISQTGPTTFQLILTGIDYDQANPPTLDSAGNRLPTDEVALSSGAIWVRVLTDASGGLQLTSSAPTYTSSSGQTAQDDPANNTESKAWTTPGIYSSGWGRGYTGSGGTTWDTTYRVSAGTNVGQYMDTGLQLHTDRADDLPVGLCSALDTRYVTFDHYEWASPVDGAVIEYYTGSDPTLDPTSASYDPNAFYCGVADGGWSTTPPADPTAVKAFRVTMTQGQVEAYSHLPHITPVVVQTIKPGTPPGTDVWSVFSGIVDLPGGADWWNGTPCINPTPGLRYPCTTGFRDLVRVIQAAPAIQKSVDRSVVTPGVPATYTLTYSANGAGSVPATVDGFEIVDTLPADMTYVPGSATPAPSVTTNGSGQQVLTWTLDGVATNVDHPLTYQAVADSSATPGQTLTNSTVASFGGVTTEPATAEVTVSTGGYTTISKTADTPFIPNLNGDGDGEGAWTVTLRSFDPLPQTFTDTIDVLPYDGDQRGTDYQGSYSLLGVEVPDGQAVYYTTADPTTVSDDPADPSNGGAGNPVGNTVGWTPVYTPAATAVRVIGPRLDPGATQSFQVRIATDGADGQDIYVNRAQARTAHTELRMRTSAPMTVAQYYSAALKKYVQDVDGAWHDAQDVTDYPTFRYGDTVRYRIVVLNTGQGTLTNLDIADDKQPQLGSFHIDSLAPGQVRSHEYQLVLDESTDGTVVNTACGQADTPNDSRVPPTINCDPAGFEVANYATVKTSDPGSGSAVYPGQKLRYTVTVTQQGSAPAAAWFTDDLAKVLDDATYNRDVEASLGTVQYRNRHIVWNGTIPVGGVARITYSVTVKSISKLGNRRLVNPVTSPGCAREAGRTADCRTGHRVGRFDLVLNKRVVGGPRVMVGDDVRYRLQVSNQGPDTAPAPIRLTDQLPRGLQLQSARGRGWDCLVHKRADIVTCVRDQALRTDRKAPPVFVVATTTRPTVGRRMVNTACVSREADSRRRNNCDTAPVTVVPVPPAPATGFRYLPRWQ